MRIARAVRKGFRDFMGVELKVDRHTVASIPERFNADRTSHNAEKLSQSSLAVELQNLSVNGNTETRKPVSLCVGIGVFHRESFEFNAVNGNGSIRGSFVF